MRDVPDGLYQWLENQLGEAEHTARTKAAPLDSSTARGAALAYGAVLREIKSRAGVFADLEGRHHPSIGQRRAAPPTLGEWLEGEAAECHRTAEQSPDPLFSGMAEAYEKAKAEYDRRAGREAGLAPDAQRAVELTGSTAPGPARRAGAALGGTGQRRRPARGPTAAADRRFPTLG